MRFDRRDLLIGLPGLAGLAMLADKASPQTAGSLQADPAAVNFWVKKMGVPEDQLPQPGPKRPAGPDEKFGLTPEKQEEGMEPFFYYFDDESDDPKTALIRSDQLTAEHLDNDVAKGKDVKVTFVKKRVRFGQTDQKAFERYATCGLYLESQQHPDAPTPNYGPMAWSLLSAVLPSFAKPPAAKKSGGSTGGTTTPSAPAGSPAAAKTTAAAPSGTLSVTLPAGIGQSAFACFLKDRQKSRFSQFLDLVLPPSGTAQPFAPLLAMPAIGSTALSMVRSIVGGLATHPAGDVAGDQQTLFQLAPTQIVATREAKLAHDKRALKMRTGTYLLVPKREADQLVTPSDFHILDGWLVAKNVTDPAQALKKKDEVLLDMSYMTIEVTVERTALSCSSSGEKKPA